MSKKLRKVKAVRNEESDWFVIPAEMTNEFFNDLDDTDLIDSGNFDYRWGCYMTGGDLNLTQLWAEL